PLPAPDAPRRSRGSNPPSCRGCARTTTYPRSEKIPERRGSWRESYIAADLTARLQQRTFAGGRAQQARFADRRRRRTCHACAAPFPTLATRRAAVNPCRAHEAASASPTGLICFTRWRVAMNSGRGGLPPNGSTSRLLIALKTRNTFERGSGEMLLFDPCMMLQSNTTTLPAGPRGATMPPLSSYSCCRLRGSG